MKLLLRPTKYSHPDRTVINVSLLLLLVLRKVRIEKYEKLKDHAKKRIEGGEVLFLPALNFLFLMGLIDYMPKTDSIEYVGG